MGRLIIDRHDFQHPATGKRLSIQYDVGLTKGLGLDLKDAGASIEVKFNANGEPVSAKNLSNGLVTGLKDYKVRGYGW